MALFRKSKSIRLNPVRHSEYSRRLKDVPDDLMERCPQCGDYIYSKNLPEDYTCPHCKYHLQFPAYDRINWLTDENSFQEMDQELLTDNPLDFPNYSKRLEQLKESTGLNEAIVTGTATIMGEKVAIGVMDSRFIMASMGTVVGEKLVRLFDHATREGLPVFLSIASGGARMQEGILSLMQMAKVSLAVSRHDQAGLYYLALLTHPTTGGVTASFAMQADTILAEPGAVIGFAGKRVIEQTVRVELPEDFQASEQVLEYGFVESIVPREDQAKTIRLLLHAHQGVND